MTMKKTLWFMVAALTSVSATALPTINEANAHGRCERLRGHGGIQAKVLTTGCTSPVGLCTAGVYEGDHLLKGTTSFVADGIAPAAGLLVEAPSTLSYSGLLTITTHRGTLTLRDTGIFDTAAGLFASRDVIVGGTGIFEGATGHVFFSGTGTSEFDSTALGEICLAH
jgi:hypothetical protein